MNPEGCPKKLRTARGYTGTPATGNGKCLKTAHKPVGKLTFRCSVLSKGDTPFCPVSSLLFLFVSFTDFPCCF